MVSKDAGELVKAISKERFQSISHLLVQFFTRRCQKGLISNLLGEGVPKNELKFWQPAAFVDQVQRFQVGQLIAQRVTCAGDFFQDPIIENSTNHRSLLRQLLELNRKSIYSGK